MEITDIWQVVTNPQIWPLFLTFLGGYVMMNVFLGHSRLKKDFSELERTLMAFAVGFLFNYFIFYPPVVLANYWHPFLTSDTYVTSAVIFCAVSAGALFYAVYGERKEKFIEKTKRALMFMMVPYSYFATIAAIMGWSVISFYPRYTAILISNSWGIFASLSFVSMLLFLAGVFFLWIFILKVSSFKLEIRKIFSKRVVLGSIVPLTIVLVASVLVVPLDIQLRMFTPQMQRGPEQLSSVMVAGTGFEKVLFINATRGPGNNVSAVYRYYALLNTTYNITLPTYGLLSSVYVDNPSNTSFTMGQFFPSIPSATDAWKLYVAAPENVTYNPILIQTPTYETKVTGLIFDFGNFTGNSSFITTLTYWQEIEPIDKVKIDYSNLTFTDLGNGTWTETHTILITNNSSDILVIPAMDYDRFNFDYVIRNSTQVFMNGNLVPYSELLSQTRLALGIWVQAQTMCNITVSFQTTSNPG